jgi:hypothetical protein
MMRFTIASTLLASTTAVHAFSDTSPFILFSTSNLDTPKSTPQLQTSTTLQSTLSSLLSSCPTGKYALISQPNLHAADIRDQDGQCHMPNICRTVRSDAVQTVYSVSEVTGQLSSSDIADQIRAACAAKGVTADVVTQQVMDKLPELGRATDKEVEERRKVLGDNDYAINHIITHLASDYTVLLFSDPNDFQPYEPSFVEPMQTDLKRRSEPVNFSRKAGNSTVDHRGLFEKYQFFTPGIFMGLIALIVMLSILGVGLTALSSLEVSYGAFDKEMGPAAQKKQL